MNCSSASPIIFCFPADPIRSTFTPQVVHCVPPRPITADDLERDRVLSQRIALFGWIEGKHLDLPEGDGSAGFLMFAQQGDFTFTFATCLLLVLI